MIIYIVKAGDTIYSIAKRYGVNPVHLMADNGLKAEDILVVGQAVVVQIPEKVYTVRQGDTLYSIAKATGISMRQIYRNNLWLKGQALLGRGSTIVLQYQEQWTKGNIMTNSYAYPYINVELLRPQLPFLSWFTPFTYGINTDGGLVQLEDETLLKLAKTYAARPLMHLSTLTEQGGFSNDRASMIFNDTEKQEKLIREIIQTLQEKNYKGLDVDFEFIYPEERYDYITFLQNLRLHLNPMGYPVFSALAPKTSDTQRGVLYEGHDYAGIGAAVNMVLLMTYEWGYTYGPPMAVAPIQNVRQVVDYALTRISREKLFLGIPTYGYDWTLPYEKGNPGAPSISPVEAVRLAGKYGAEILFDEKAQAPWFRYADEEGSLHEVWFEDARSILAKLNLVYEYGLVGIGYWNSMREFPQNWVVLNHEFQVTDRPQIAF